MARKPGLARQPVASPRGPGACTVTPAPAGDETWPELRSGAARRCWGPPRLPGAERVARGPMQLPGPGPARLLTWPSSPLRPIPNAPNWAAL